MEQGLGRKLWRLVVENKRLVILAVCAIVFVALLEDVLEGELGRLDRAAYALIVERLRADWLTPVMESISALATPVSLIVFLLVIVALSAILAPVIAPHNPLEITRAYQPPSAEHIFGTDYLGRDVFSRVLSGARTSIFATLVLVIISFIIG